MTSRGNPSISPPAQSQIPLQSQPRQVNFSGLPSGTPPPQQQFYPGQSQVQSGGVYDFISPGSQPQGLFTYQAYGSAPNDLRAGVSSGRGGGGVQQHHHHHQANGMFPPQPGQQGMRPQQAAGAGPTYFISGQGGMRQPRPPQQPTMMFVTPQNMVIQPSMYQPRMPMYQTNQQFPAFAGNYPPMYYPPAAPMGPRGALMNPQNTSRPGPPPREKKIIAIKDPTSGRNIDLKEELSHDRPHSNEPATDQAVNEAPMHQPTSDVANEFARQVANLLKNPETQGEVEGYASNGGEYQAAPAANTPQQAAQMAHPAMVRPPMQGHMLPAQAPLQPGHMLPPHQAPPTMDLSLPPPQLPPTLTRPRAPAPQMYNVPAVQQQQSAPHPAPVPGAVRHPVAVVPPPMMAPAMPPQPAPTQAPAPSPTVTEEAREEPNIPSAVVEAKPEPVVAEVSPPAPREPSPEQETTAKPDDAASANNQVNKDGRKGKKTKKDFSRKDIGGSDMDAFIDSLPQEEQQQPSEPVSQGPETPLNGDEEKDPAPDHRKESETQKKELPVAQDKSGESLESTDAKPPLPPAANVERPSSVEKETPVVPAPVAEKPVFSYAAAATASVESFKAKETTPPPPPTPPAATEVTRPVKEEEPKKEVPKVPTKDETVKDVSVDKIQELPSPQKPAQAVQQAPQKPPPQPVPQKPDQPTTQPAPQEPTLQQASPVNDENAPPKETKQEKIEEAAAKDEEGSKKPADKPKPKQDDKEKLQYDRKYLMELRECPSSQTKPEGLPNLDIILDKPNISPIRGTMNAPLDFTPSFFQPTAGTTRHAPQIGKSSSRGRQRPDMPQQRIIKSVSIQNDIKSLHQSEKPWKPKASGNAGDSEKKSLESDVLFIMNRLTPTNFEKLAMEMKQLSIKTYDDLENLVRIFFDKVTIETKFVTAYAQLCRVLSVIKVPPPPEKGMKENQATFRVVMLTKCQQEFEADKSIVFEDPEEKRKKLMAEMEDKPDKEEKIDEVLYRMKLKRLKFYGNIRFIGELFKLGMLTENIMHDCIFRLLKARDDDSLLSLCNLITTVGQMLDTDKAKSRMDQYFTQMEKIAEERKSRIKFTLKDAIELRRHHWVPRKETTGPKKITEVHKDYQQEQVRQQIMSAQPLPPRNETPQPGSRRGSRQKPEEPKQPNDDGWNTVGSKSMRIDASKMKLSKNVVDEDSIQLGPGGGMNKFSMWSRGSFGGGSQSSQDSDRPAAGNRFSALRNDDDRRTFQRSPSRGDTAGRGMRQGPTAGHGRGKILARSSQEGERRDLLASARSIVGGGRSQNSSRDNSRNREDRRPAMGPRGSREGENIMSRSDITRPTSEDMRPPPVTVTPAAKKVKEMSEEEIETKAKTILEEYLNIKDLAEAKLCVTELAGQPHLHLVVTASINDVLERSNQARDLTGQYLHELVCNQIISLDVYIKGLTEVLQNAEDMVIDIPMMWDYLAHVTSPLLVGGSLPWSKLSAVLRPALDQRCALIFLTKLVVQAKTLSNESEVASQWQNSGLSWATFVGDVPSEVDSYLSDHKLEFTVKPASGNVDVTRLAQQVETLVSQGKANQEIKALIEKHVPSEKRDGNFIRALTTAITNASITRPELKVNDDVIKTHREVLQAYINTTGQELQALYAIQALMAKLEHPKGVIIDLFELLYNEELISEEALKQWETSSDPSEQEGKGACSMQLTQLFTWLRENEEVEPAS